MTSRQTTAGRPFPPPAEPVDNTRRARIDRLVDLFVDFADRLTSVVVQSKPHNVGAIKVSGFCARIAGKHDEKSLSSRMLRFARVFGFDCT